MGQTPRLALSDVQWARIEHLCPGKAGDAGGRGRDNRMFVEGVSWLARTGVPWRDLPAVFGRWNSVFQRSSRWSRGGIRRRIFGVLSDDPDAEYPILDSTIVRAHRHAAGAEGGPRLRPSAARAAA